MPSSCQDIRAALAQCLQESDCVMIYRNKPSDCLRAPLLETMPTKCQQLKTGYGECKRGLVDMRKRFRGNQPISVSKEIEGGEREIPVDICSMLESQPLKAGSKRQAETNPKRRTGGSWRTRGTERSKQTNTHCQQGPLGIAFYTRYNWGCILHWKAFRQCISKALHGQG
ncbi:cytochrome c oxidase assembly protein [Botrytis cinerea]